MNNTNDKGPKPKILHIDDEEHIRYLYSEELTETGYHVISMHPKDIGIKRKGTLDGVIETIEQEQPDIVLLDIKMLEFDGLDALERIKQSYLNLPVILVTIFDDYKKDYKAIAADYYVIKEINLSRLKNKVRLALDESAPRSQIYQTRGSS